ncbi:MAG: hypothetical protein V3575_02260 [Candidatus Absconditabacteria bacterium]
MTKIQANGNYQPAYEATGLSNVGQTSKNNIDVTKLTISELIEIFGEEAVLEEI